MSAEESNSQTEHFEDFSKVGSRKANTENNESLTIKIPIDDSNSFK